jgi:hypothetical protein
MQISEIQSFFGIAKLPAEYDNPDYDPDYDKIRDGRLGVSAPTASASAVQAKYCTAPPLSQ